MKIRQYINDSAAVEITERRCGSVSFYDFHISYPEPTVPKPITFKFVLDVHDVYSVFHSTAKTERYIKPSWNPNTEESRLAVGIPQLTAIKRDGINAATLALSDAKVPSKLFIGAIEESGKYLAGFTLFPTPISKTGSFDITLRIDTGDERYERSIASAIEYLETCGYKSAPVPEAATWPMNSAWYSYHQDIDVSDIIKECRLSKAIGMDTLILDDGWQTEDTSHGYAYCGDWEVCPAKVPNMKEFADAVHAEGMKLMLWYSVPFVGIHSRAYGKFRDMLLDGDEEKKWYCLDPRYPEVRKYLADIYKNALVNYGLDGFKLDFIDAFTLTEYSLKPDERRDTESLEDALEALLSEVYSALTSINPSVLLEFRQKYVGPTVRKYGNMLRVRDCPEDPLSNRYGAIDLRLTSGKTAVHSDMLMWNTAMSAEDAATELVSVLFAVPQISLKLASMPKDHLRMLSFYLDFIRKNRDTLLFGALTADDPEALYSRVRAEKDGRFITALYNDQLDTLPGSFESYTVVNGTAHKKIIIDTPEAVSYEILNCFGDSVEKGSLEAGIHKLAVPKCGMIKFQP